MTLLSKKHDSVTDVTYDQKYMDVAPPAYSRSPGTDITVPRTYDLKSTKMDRIYSGAYSLRVDGTQNEVWNVNIQRKALEVFRHDGSLVGVANLSCWSSEIDVTMSGSGATLSMKRNQGMFNQSKSFVVPETGEVLTWKRAGKLSAKFELLDDAGRVVAWIGRTSWRRHHYFEVVRPGMHPAVVEAVMVTALATAEHEKRAAFNASIAATA